MSRKKNWLRGVWFGLAGLVIGLGLGYLGASLLGGGSLLGTSNKSVPEGLSLDSAAFLLQMERTEELDEQIRQSVEDIRNKVEKKENTELEMIQLQSLMSKRNQAFEMMSSMLQKDSKTRDSIIRNLD